MIDGIEKLLMSSLNEPINIGNPREISMMELAKLILRITGASSGIVHQDLPVDDPKVRRPDITKAKTLTGNRRCPWNRTSKNC